MQTPDTAAQFALNEAEKAAFREQGFFGPFPVYAQDEMRKTWRRLRLQLMDRSHAAYGSDVGEGLTNIANYDRHLDNEFLADHVCRPQIVDRVRSALGPDLLCWRSEFFPKYPGDEGTDWHQADTFAHASGRPQLLWPEELSDFGGTITVWTAFTEANQETACLQFIPGTQDEMHYDESKGMEFDLSKSNQVDKDGVRRGFFGYDYRKLQVDPDWSPDESRAVSMVLRPGEAVMFWSTLMHASHPHTGKSQEMRMGYAARYVPTCVRVYPDTEVIQEYGGSVSLDRYGAVVVCGRNDFTHNRIVTQTTRGHAFTTR